MTKPKLTYFDFHGGRGEPVRLALSIGGIEFEDHRISFQEFGQLRAEFPFLAAPVLEIDGKRLTQSNAMLRYFAPQAGLWPSDPMLAYRCDEVLGAVEDATHKYTQTFGLEGDALKAAREALVEGTVRPYLRSFDRVVAETDGPYVCGAQLSVADLKLFAWLRGMQSGNQDHVPTDIVEQESAPLAALRDAVAEHDGVKAYYERVMK